MTTRFGVAVQPWLDRLPAELSTLAERWQLDRVRLIPRGSMSAVFACRTQHGDAILKLSPDRDRLATEAAALRLWATRHAPAVRATDEAAGALLIEAIIPGTVLIEAPAAPPIERIGELLAALHSDPVPVTGFPPLPQRVAHLFEAGRRPYQRHPALIEIVPPELYERGHRLAIRLLEHRLTSVLLHGDLTPSNVLDGGPVRGLVAIDPAPCTGDPAFDAVDLLLWRATGADEITTRAERLAAATGTDPARMCGWVGAFAGMIALETAEVSIDDPRVAVCLSLAAR